MGCYGSNCGEGGAAEAGLGAWRWGVPVPAAAWAFSLNMASGQEKRQDKIAGVLVVQDGYRLKANNCWML